MFDILYILLYIYNIDSITSITQNIKVIHLNKTYLKKNNESLLRQLEEINIFGNTSFLNYYYSELYIGKNKQIQSYILDTGSSITTSPCNPYCSKCGKHLYGLYNVEDDSKIVSCGTELCNLVTNRCGANQRCSFSISYSEGSSLSGYFINDYVSLKNDSFLPEKTVPIGCTISENHLFYTQLADGIMGLVNSEKNFVSILYRNNIIKENIFSLCLSQDGGYFSLGEIDNKYHLNNEIKYINISKPNYYYINPSSIFINDKEIKTYSKNFFVDSGTTLTYLSNDILSFIINEFKEHCKKYEKKCGEYEYINDLGACFNFKTNKDMEYAINNIFPNISFTLSEDYIFNWTAQNYYFNDSDGGKFRMCLGFADAYGSKNVLGSSWMHGHDIIFDRENNRLGFVLADCDRKIVKAKEDENIFINESLLNNETNKNNTNIKYKDLKKIQLENVILIILLIVSICILILFIFILIQIKRGKNVLCFKKYIRLEEVPPTQQSTNIQDASTENKNNEIINSNNLNDNNNNDNNNNNN